MVRQSRQQGSRRWPTNWLWPSHLPGRIIQQHVCDVHSGHAHTVAPTQRRRAETEVEPWTQHKGNGQRRAECSTKTILIRSLVCLCVKGSCPPSTVHAPKTTAPPLTRLISTEQLHLSLASISAARSEALNNQQGRRDGTVTRDVKMTAEM